MKTASKSKSVVIKEEVRERDGAVYKFTLSSGTSKRTASFNLPLYSIEVELLMDGKLTSRRLTDAFADGGKAIVFFNRVVENLITPIDLPYAFEDKLWE